MNPITHQAGRFQSDFGLTCFVACEIEFYLHGSDGKDVEPFWKQMREACGAQNIPIHKCEKERGHEQHEVALGVVSPEKAAADCIALKRIVMEAALVQGFHADFAAKPFENEPGSGLHVHVHLEKNGKNVFYKHDAVISDELKFSIGGLLAALPRDMEIFAPTIESRKRFVAGSNAPLTISWGANNRTVAVRLPDKPPQDKHIEHRISGADADPALVIEAVLRAMHEGITQKIEPGAQIYGDASLEQYGLPRLIA